MSALPATAAHNLEPPVPNSSVPRCPCLAVQPCACERFASRLEDRHRRDQLIMLTSARALGLIAAMEGVSAQTREAVLNVASELF